MALPYKHHWTPQSHTEKNLRNLRKPGKTKVDGMHQEQNTTAVQMQEYVAATQDRTGWRQDVRQVMSQTNKIPLLTYLLAAKMLLTFTETQIRIS